MRYVIYRHPEVKDKYYDDYDWVQDQSPFDSKSEAREAMPSVGSPVGEGYNYAIIEYEDDEEIKSSLTTREKRQRS